MDKTFWTDYARSADTNYNQEFAAFIRDLALSLRCSSILEVGCNAANDIKLCTEKLETHGIDIEGSIIDIARQRLPGAHFKTGSVTDLPYEDASVDIIFTHGFFNYLDDDLVDAGVGELFRVSRKYVANCEVCGDDNVLDESRSGRNMLKRWSDYKVKIISNVQMHKEIDPQESFFTLVRKL